MRWTSSKDSVDTGEMSALAVIETVAAVSATVAAYVLTRSIWHIAVASMLAPILLLRTPESMSRAIRMIARSEPTGILNIDIGEMYDRTVMRKWDKFVSNLEIVFLLVPVTSIVYFMLITALLTAVFVVKIFSTINAIFKRSIYTLSQMPGNWRRVILCADIFTRDSRVPAQSRLRRRAGRPAFYLCPVVR